MSSWKEYKLGDVIELKYGKDHKALNDGNIPVFGSGGIMRYADTFLYDDESILIPRKGTLNNIFYIKEPFWTVDTIFWSKINTKEAFGKFLFYQLKTIDFTNLNVGSAVPSLTTKVLNEVDISLPPLEEQKAIAEVLSSLDDKIDLLHRQNKTLEELAQTLFRQWFIEEAKEEWEKKPLKDICAIINGFAFKSGDYRESGRAIIRTMNFKQGFIDTSNVVYIDLAEEIKYSKQQLQRNDFLLVMVGASLGNFSIVTSDVLPALQNQNMWNFRSLGNISQHYLNFALRQIIENNIGSASGSAREFFQKGQFYEFLITVPSKEIVQRFHDSVENFFLKIENNRMQIQTLENLRDTLLPKLMSGEVRVGI